MATVKSSAENLTLNADGANNDIIFQSNGSNVATLDQAGTFTATSFAGSGANLTGITHTDSSKLPLAGGTMTGNLVVNTASPNVDMIDTGTSHASTDYITNSNAVRVTVGAEQAAGGGLFVGSSAYAAVFGTASAGSTQFATNNTVRMTIDTAGAVGIGVVPETWDANYDALQIGGNGAVAATPSQAAGGKTLLGQNVYVDTSYKYISTDEASLIYQQNGEHKFRVAASGTADAAITWTDALIIKNDGRGVSQFTFAFWASVNQQGTQAILDSHNLSSITDHGTGDTKFTFSNAMPDTTYCALQPGTNNNAGGWFTHTETTYCRFIYYENSYLDVSKLMVAVVGDN